MLQKQKFASNTVQCIFTRYIAKLLNSIRNLMFSSLQQINKNIYLCAKLQKCKTVQCFNGRFPNLKCSVTVCSD